MEPDLEMLTLDGQLPVFHPGEILKCTIFPRLELSSTTIQERLGLSRSELDDILAGARDIDTKLAEKISALVGGTPDIWLRMQATYDLVSKLENGPQPRSR
jgi:antitoxin HigA-1